MKKAALFTFVLALLVGGIIIYGMIGSKLDIKPLDVLRVPAVQQPAEFKRLQDAVNNRSLIGTAFQNQLPGDASEYELVVYTVEVYNRGLVSAQMAELMISPADGDILCYTDGSAEGKLLSIPVPAGKKSRVRCILLKKISPRPSIVRDAYLSYYILGNPFTIKVTFS